MSPRANSHNAIAIRRQLLRWGLAAWIAILIAPATTFVRGVNYFCRPADLIVAAHLIRRRLADAERHHQERKK